MTYKPPRLFPELWPLLHMQGDLPISAARAAAAFGINVYVTDFGPADVAAILIRNDRLKTIAGAPDPAPGGWSIFVNGAPDFTEQRMAVAHQLGHVLMHSQEPALRDGLLRDNKVLLTHAPQKEATYFQTTETPPAMEREADEFARTLLLPLERALPLYMDMTHRNNLPEIFQVPEYVVRDRFPTPSSTSTDFFWSGVAPTRTPTFISRRQTTHAAPATSSAPHSAFALASSFSSRPNNQTGHFL